MGLLAEIEDFKLSKNLVVSIGEEKTELHVECDFEVDENYRISGLKRIWVKDLKTGESEYIDDTFFEGYIRKILYAELPKDENFKSVCFEALNCEE